MKNILANTLLIWLIFVPTKAHPAHGYIATDATIIKIGNTIYSATSSAFFVVVSGGTGVCQGVSIVFNLSDTDAETQQRAYAAALAAFASGAKVSIYSWEDSSVCDRAAYIELHK